MAKTMKNEKRDNKYTSKNILSSIRSFKPEGIECNVTNVSEVMEDLYSKKPMVGVTIAFLETMPKVRARVIKDGKVVKEENEVTGQVMDKMTIEENVSELEIPFYFNMNFFEESTPEDQEYIVYNSSKFYPLVNYAFQEADLIPKGNKDNIIFNYEELVEALIDCTFIGTVDNRKYNSITYNVLVANPLYETQVVEG